MADKAQRRQQADLKALYQAQMSTPQGRAFVWHLAQLAGVGSSIWEQSARIHWRSGQQDFGLTLLRDVRMWDYRLADLMTREAADRDLRANELSAGTNTRSATEEETNGD